MTKKRSFGNLFKTFFLLIFLGVFASACSSSSNEVFLVSLGDSLAVGIQPDASGTNQETDEGYPDQLFAQLAADNPDLRLVKFGCPGETTVTMLVGGKCEYEEGSQLDQAVKFILDNRDRIFLVTIDIGVNDVLTSRCIDLETMQVDQECLAEDFAAIASNLSLILSTLFSAVTADTPVIGANYYNSFLATWFMDPAFAQLSAVLADTFNTMVLQPVYDLMGFPVADVASAFQSNDFTTMVPNPVPPPATLPINVALICQLTYMCVPPPVGPNVHANADGYQLIAATFLAVFNGL